MAFFFLYLRMTRILFNDLQSSIKPTEPCLRLNIFTKILVKHVHKGLVLIKHFQCIRGYKLTRMLM